MPALSSPSTPPAPKPDGGWLRAARTNPYRVVVFTVALVAALHTVHQLLPVVVALLLTVGFALLIDVPVRALTRARVPRPVAAGVVVLTVLGAGAAAIVGLVPAITGQLHTLSGEGSLLTTLMKRVNDAEARLHLPSSLHVSADSIRHLLAHVDAAGIAANAGTAVTLVLFSLMAATWAVASPDPLRERLVAFVPPARRDVVIHVVGHALDRLRRWVFGVATLSVTMGLLTYVALLLLGVPFAALFAVIAGLCEVVPTVGVLIGAAGPVLVTVVEHPSRLPALLIGIVIAHQVEDRVLSPLVMRRAVDMPPTLTVFAVLTFASVLGLLGGLIAVPATAVAFAVHDALTDGRGQPDAGAAPAAQATHEGPTTQEGPEPEPAAP